MKKLLILKASKSVCGNETGLIRHHAQLLGMDVLEEEVRSESFLIELLTKYANEGVKIDYLYLCTHGDGEGFEIDTGLEKEEMSWYKFAGALCESGILKDGAIILLACCRGGLFKVTSVMMAACNLIKFICGVKWTVHSWDLTTGFIVFLYQIEKRNSEPGYAAKKSSLATDYTFECYDREEIESNPHFKSIQQDLFFELGWTDEYGNWQENDPIIKRNVGIFE